VSKKTEELVEALSHLTVLEMAELKKALEDKWGVKAAAAAVAMAAPAGGGGAAPAAAAEASDFQVTLTGAADDKKIGIIKIIREITGPKVVKETAPKADAEEMKKKLEAAGAKVTLKGL